MKESKDKWLHGIIPPIVTPLLDHDQLDVTGFKNLIEHMLAGGVHGLFLLGTTGEGPSLSHALRRKLIAVAVQQVAGRVPILVCISDSSLAESIELAEFAASEGAQAVVATSPYYFPISQDELLGYIQQLAGAVSLPLVLYNIPQMTNTWFEVDTIRRALELGNIAGIKDSSGDMRYFNQLLGLVSHREDCSLLIGAEERLEEAVRSGADGGVCGGANMFPRLYSDLFEAARKGDSSLAQSLHGDVIQVSEMLYSIGERGSRLINSIKGTLSQLGICQDVVSPPLLTFDGQEKNILSERLQALSKNGPTSVKSVFDHYAVPEVPQHTRHDIGSSYPARLKPSGRRLPTASNASTENGKGDHFA